MRKLNPHTAFKSGKKRALKGLKLDETALSKQDRNSQDLYRQGYQVGVEKLRAEGIAPAYQLGKYRGEQYAAQLIKTYEIGQDYKSYMIRYLASLNCLNEMSTAENKHFMNGFREIFLKKFKNFLADPVHDDPDWKKPKRKRVQPDKLGEETTLDERPAKRARSIESDILPQPSDPTPTASVQHSQEVSPPPTLVPATGETHDVDPSIQAIEPVLATEVPMPVSPLLSRFSFFNNPHLDPSLLPMPRRIVQPLASSWLPPLPSNPYTFMQSQLPLPITHPLNQQYLQALGVLPPPIPLQAYNRYLPPLPSISPQFNF